MFEKDVQIAVSGLAEALVKKHWKMATADSCTGGWIAKCCTDMAGSSAWFDRGFVTYSNEAKCEMLGVDAGVIESDGAVSQAVAEQMADRARALSSVEAALGVTGIAGPGGGTAEKPVGTVWIAWSIAGHELISRCFRFDGDRQAVRQQTVLKALEELLLLLDRP